MPFRERIKKTFRRTSSNSSGPPKQYDPSDRTSSLYYQPGEKIPYKYRRPVEPAHQAKLDSFSWGTAWRRRSNASQYSPMGSRLPSRNNSNADGCNPFEGVQVSMGSLDNGSNENSRSGSSGSAASNSIKMNGHNSHHHHGPAAFDPNRLEPIMSVQSASRDERDSNSENEREQEVKKQTINAPFSADELDAAFQRAEKIKEPPSPKA